MQKRLPAMGSAGSVCHSLRQDRGKETLPWLCTWPLQLSSCPPLTPTHPHLLFHSHSGVGSSGYEQELSSSTVTFPGPCALQGCGTLDKVLDIF